MGLHTSVINLGKHARTLIASQPSKLGALLSSELSQLLSQPSQLGRALVESLVHHRQTSRAGLLEGPLLILPEKLQLLQDHPLARRPVQGRSEAAVVEG